MAPAELSEREPPTLASTNMPRVDVRTFFVVPHASDDAAGEVSLVCSTCRAAGLAFADLAVEVGSCVAVEPLLGDAGDVEHAVDPAVAAEVESVADRRGAAFTRRQRNVAGAAPANHTACGGACWREHRVPAVSDAAAASTEYLTSRPNDVWILPAAAPEGMDVFASGRIVLTSTLRAFGVEGDHCITQSPRWHCATGTCPSCRSNRPEPSD